MLRLAIAVWLSANFGSVSGWALPWLVTSYVEIDIKTIITATTFTAISITESALIDTNIVAVVPTVSPIPILSIVTTVDDIYTDLTEVQILLPTGAGSSIGRNNYFDDLTTYYVELLYTAPTNCPSPRWTYSTIARVDAPPAVTFAPTSVSTQYTVPYAFAATSENVYAFVNPTDIPDNELSSLKQLWGPLYTDECTLPSYLTATTTRGSSTPTRTSSSGSTSSPDSNPSSNNWADCDPFEWTFAGAKIGSGYICPDGTYYTQGMTITNFVVIWIFTWFGVFLIIGCIESYINFSKLARGRKARRGMPVAFACLAPLLSCFCLCFRNPGYTAKSPEEQALLTAQWNSTPFFTRIGRWLKWGFRFKYPLFLGDAPARRPQWGNNVQPGVNGQNARGNIGPRQEVTGTSAGGISTPVVAEMEQPQINHELPSGERRFVDQKGAFNIVTV